MSNSSQKTLAVFSVVLDQGPVSPGRICEETGFSRVFVHRALHALMDQGWVRMRLGDKAYLTTAGFEDRVAGATVPLPEQDRLIEPLRFVCDQFSLQADIAMLIAEGRIQVVESTNRKADLETPISLIFDPMALAIFQAIPPQQMLRHLKHTIEADPEAAKEARSGRFKLRLAEVQRHGPWLCSRDSLIMPFRSSGGSVGAVKFWKSRRIAHPGQIFVSAAATLQREVPGLFLE